MSVIDISEVDELTGLDSRRPHTRALFVYPTYYRIGDHINPFMRGEVDEDHLTDQFTALKEGYEKYVDTYTIDPDEYANNYADLRPPEELPDFVFAANQSLPYREHEFVIKSNMAMEQRRGEPEYFSRFFENEHDWEVIELPEEISFEGNGDGIWHPGTDLLWGGYNPITNGYTRTDPEAYEYISQFLDVPVITLPIQNDDYYHLDTCFMPLDRNTVIIAENAFEDVVETKLKQLWETVIVVPTEEATNLNCNVHRVANNVVFASTNVKDTETFDSLIDAGFRVETFELSEFHKGGGSVYCMKQMF